jgi:lipid-A-disaccharide synthase
MYVILPFEVDWYNNKGVEVDYAGHPLIDEIEKLNHTKKTSERILKQLGINENKPIIALLPGSRRQEIKQMLEIMLSVVPFFEKYQFVIAGAPSIEKEFYREYVEKYSQVDLVENRTYELLQVATSALVTSGTAPLETALFEVPQVVCYRGNPMSFALAKMLVGHRIKFIAMPNIIADFAVVKELIQNDLTTTNLKKELAKTLSQPSRAQIIEGYQIIKSKLGGSGVSHKIAKMMVERLSK